MTTTRPRQPFSAAVLLVHRGRCSAQLACAAAVGPSGLTSLRSGLVRLCASRPSRLSHRVRGPGGPHCRHIRGWRLGQTLTASSLIRAVQPPMAIDGAACSAAKSFPLRAIPNRRSPVRSRSATHRRPSVTEARARRRSGIGPPPTSGPRSPSTRPSRRLPHPLRWSLKQQQHRSSPRKEKTSPYHAFRHACPEWWCSGCHHRHRASVQRHARGLVMVVQTGHAVPARWRHRHPWRRGTSVEHSGGPQWSPRASAAASQGRIR
jgi:hypothetical protein